MDVVEAAATATAVVRERLGDHGELRAYRRPGPPEHLALEEIRPSIGTVGDAYDNALMESINGLYKAEVIHRRSPWRSFEAVEFATLEWVAWFNSRRRLEPIGNIPPAEAEAAYYAQLEMTRIAA